MSGQDICEGGRVMSKEIMVPFLCGDGTGEIMIPAAYVADFPKNKDGVCSFCNNDPCAEFSPPESRIAKYFKRNKKWAEVCPCCKGMAP
jgi:hypothetical protein